MIHYITCVARLFCTQCERVCVYKSFTPRLEEVKYVSVVNSLLLGIGPENPRIPVTLLKAFC